MKNLNRFETSLRNLIDGGSRGKLFSVVALGLAIFLPICGLPASIYLAKEARKQQRRDALAELGIRVSIFLLIIWASFLLHNFFISVIAPSL